MNNLSLIFRILTLPIALVAYWVALLMALVSVAIFINLSFVMAVVVSVFTSPNKNLALSKTENDQHNWPQKAAHRSMK